MVLTSWGYIRIKRGNSVGALGTISGWLAPLSKYLLKNRENQFGFIWMRQSFSCLERKKASRNTGLSFVCLLLKTFFFLAEYHVQKC